MFNKKISLMTVTLLIEKTGGVKKSLAFKRGTKIGTDLLKRRDL
jgi:hypothetical protein